MLITARSYPKLYVFISGIYNFVTVVASQLILYYGYFVTWMLNILLRCYLSLNSEPQQIQAATKLKLYGTGTNGMNGPWYKKSIRTELAKLRHELRNYFIRFKLINHEWCSPWYDKSIIPG